MENNEKKVSVLESRILAVQQEVEAIKKDSKNPFFKSMYFDINSILAELKPLLNKHNLVVLQPLSVLHDGSPAIETIITCEDSGCKPFVHATPLPVYREETTKEFVDKNGATIKQTTVSTDPQKMGAMITYYRRYALQSLFLLEAEDDDAESAVIHHPVVASSGVSRLCNTCNKPFEPKVGQEWATQCVACYFAKVRATPKTKTVVNPDVPPFEG